MLRNTRQNEKRRQDRPAGVYPRRLEMKTKNLLVLKLVIVIIKIKIIRKR